MGFTKEQVRTHKKVTFEKTGIELEISDYFNPNEFSIEEAVVIATHPEQTLFKPGDSVLIDFSVFTAGKHDQFENVDEMRFVSSDEQYDYYWLYDTLHPMACAEVFATISDKGEVDPIGDVIIIYPEPKESYRSIAGILMPAQDRISKPFVAKVFATPKDCIIKKDDEILCEGGFGIKIKYRGIEMEYINYGYILGKMVENQLKLF